MLSSLLPSSTEKVVGTATPKEATAECQAAWDFSTGDELMISWESSSLTSGLKFALKNAASPDSLVMSRFLLPPDENFDAIENLAGY